MAEDQKPESIMTPGTDTTAQFQIHRLYAKDVSFEVPNAPAVFNEEGQADVKMSLSQRVESLGEDLHEVVLTVTVTASVGEKTAYLAEVAQAGTFLVAGFNEQATHAVMNTMCPGTLFPYARQTIASLIANGGFPPLTLQPVNFEQLYAQRMQQMINEQNQQGGDGDGSDEIVSAEFPSQN